MIKKLRPANKTDLNLWSYYCELLSSAFYSFQILIFTKVQLFVCEMSYL